MMKQYLLFLIINIIILFNLKYCDAQQTCQNLSNFDCQTCLSGSGCGYCKTTKSCFSNNLVGLVDVSCKPADMQIQTCYVSFQVWIIVVIVIVAIVILAIVIAVCCLCRKCKRCRIRKEERRQEVDTQRMEERRAAAEVRTTERNKVADQIRMKYGILKEKDNGTDYTRMS